MIAHPVAFGVIAAFSLAVNIVLGQRRARANRFSRAWFLWVHLSVPFIIALRMHFALRPLVLVIPMLLACAVAGQVAGGKLDACRRPAR